MREDVVRDSLSVTSCGDTAALSLHLGVRAANAGA